MAIDLEEAEFMVEFTPFPKIPRLNRDIVITEKIDGTNAAVVIEPFYKRECALSRGVTKSPYVSCPFNNLQCQAPTCFENVPDGYRVYAQSRSRLITPQDDNFGFAKWVESNADALYETLGFGVHFGEWWGSGIQRGYGLQKGEKRFSLFNVKRWGDVDLSSVPGLGVVPELYSGPWIAELNQLAPDLCIDMLIKHGSVAAPGFMNPEGIIVFHTAANSMFKVTCRDDASPKGLV